MQLSSTGYGQQTRRRVVAAALLLLFCTACSFFAKDQREEQERQAQFTAHAAAGEAALGQRNFAVALSAFADAHRLAPQEPLVAYRLGYVHEYFGHYPEAAQAYREGLKAEAIPPELKRDLAFRLALLEAFHLGGAKRLPELLAQLPPDSPQAADILAVLALLEGDGHEALAALNRARSGPISQELAAILLYHAARAYHLIGDHDRVLPTLYNAVNQSNYTPVSREIDAFRDEIQHRPRP